MDFAAGICASLLLVSGVDLLEEGVLDLPAADDMCFDNDTPSGSGNRGCLGLPMHCICKVVWVRPA
jgi:hypothetical protein